jgi:hypothetical protein
MILGRTMSVNLGRDEIDLILAREAVIQVYSEKYDKLKSLSDFENEIIQEANELSKYVKNKDSRTFCILIISFMEDILKRNFINYWQINSKNKIDLYFGSNGPLNSFAQRVLIALSINWITNEEYKDINLLRKIRNEFAHNHKIYSLEKDPLLSHVDSIIHEEKIWLKSLPPYEIAYNNADLETKLRIRIYCRSMNIIYRIIARSKSIEAEIPPEFRPESGYKSFMEVEKLFIDNTIYHCFGVLGIMERNT